MVKKRRRKPTGLADERSMPINYQGIRHAPENELGVVFLFSKVARKFGFTEIDVIQPHFPDCWAFRRTNNGARRTWIEFEFKSHSFKTHLPQLKGLRPKKGVVVCWENDWAQCSRYAEVLELRSELGFGSQVWIQNTLPQYQANIDFTPRRTNKNWQWTVSGRARPGDILLMYRAGSKATAREYAVEEDLLQSIANVFVVKSFPKADRRWGYMATVSQVALLNNPLRLQQMRADRVLRYSPFVRRSMIGRSNVTPYWYRLYDLIIKLNSDRGTRKALQKYHPERF